MQVAAWRNVNIVGRINEDAVRRARLVLRWMTVFDGHSTLVYSLPSHTRQLSFLPSAGREMSTDQRDGDALRLGTGYVTGWFIPRVDKRAGGR